MPDLTQYIQKKPSLWDLYTRKEEYGTKQLDNHQRFIHRFSRFPDVSTPAVSMHLLSEGFCPDYPEGHPFCVCLTQDVDEIYPPLSHTIASSWQQFRRGEINNITSDISWKFRGRDASLYRNFDTIIKMEEEVGAGSSFILSRPKKMSEGSGVMLKKLKMRSGR